MRYKNSINIFVLFALLLQNSLVAMQDASNDPAAEQPKNKCYLTEMTYDVFKYELLPYFSLPDEVALMKALSDSKNYRNLAQDRLAEIENGVLNKIDKVLAWGVKDLCSRNFFKTTECPTWVLARILQYSKLEGLCRVTAREILGGKADILWVNNYVTTKLVDLFLKRGALAHGDPCSCCGQSPLAYVVGHNYEKAARLLLDAKANPNGKCFEISREGILHFSMTPLMCAVKNNDPGMVALLLNAGANVNAISEMSRMRALGYSQRLKMSALDIALEKGNEKIINLLQGAQAQSAPEIEKAWMWKKYVFGTGMFTLGAAWAIGRYLYKKWKAKKEAREKANNQTLPAVRVA